MYRISYSLWTILPIFLIQDTFNVCRYPYFSRFVDLKAKGVIKII